MEQQAPGARNSFRGDIEVFLRAGKQWIDGQLRRRGAPFGTGEEHETALSLVAPINADYAAERAFPPFLTDSDLNRNRVTSNWRESLKEIRDGVVDLEIDDTDEFLGWTAGRAWGGSAGTGSNGSAPTPTPTPTATARVG